MFGTRFVARLGARARIADLAALEHRLAALVVAGEARVPGAPITRESFVDAIADGLAATTDVVDLATLDLIRAEDLYLARALGRGDPRALAIFEAELVPALLPAIRKIAADAAFVDEVSQRVRERLLVGDGTPAIDQYRGTGPLVRWLRVTATRIALDIKRADARRVDDDEPIAALAAPDDPELAVIWQTCADHYKAAITAAFHELTARERTLLRQRYLDGLDLDALGRAHRVHASTVSRWLDAIQAQLAQATRSALREQLALTDSQARSIERLVGSDLHLSLPRLLRGGKRGA